MALDAAASWAADIAAAIQSVKPDDNAKVTNQQLIDIWTAVKEQDTAQLAKADVAPNSFNIINPETSSPVPVTGIGGPVT